VIAAGILARPKPEKPSLTIKDKDITRYLGEQSVRVFRVPIASTAFPRLEAFHCRKIAPTGAENNACDNRQGFPFRDYQHNHVKECRKQVAKTIFFSFN
jgi:hypothetical protein